ncbi:MAG: hypothetical protein AB7U73_20255 [Pirellulales bacterium]
MIWLRRLLLVAMLAAVTQLVVLGAQPFWERIALGVLALVLIVVSVLFAWDA